MANLSNAKGVILFEEDFLNMHRDDVIDWAKNRKNPEVGITYLEFDDNDNVVHFDGVGIHTFEDTLHSQGGLSFLDKADRDFAQLLASENSQITLEFSDYEPGCCVLYKETVSLRFHNDLSVELTTLSETNYGYIGEPLKKRDIAEVMDLSGFDFNNTEQLEKCMTRIGQIHKPLSPEEKAAVISVVNEDQEMDGFVIEDDIESDVLKELVLEKTGIDISSGSNFFHLRLDDMVSLELVEGEPPVQAQVVWKGHNPSMICDNNPNGLFYIARYDDVDEIITWDKFMILM